MVVVQPLVAFSIHILADCEVMSLSLDLIGGREIRTQELSTVAIHARSWKARVTVEKSFEPEPRKKPKLCEC